MSADNFKARTLKRKNVKGLALNASQPKPSAPSAGDAQIPGALGNSIDRPDTLEIGVEFRLDLRSEDLIVLKELGAGNGGTVSKVVHAATKVVMARKVIHVEAKKEVRKQIVRELHIMHDCNSPYIVSFYGAFLNDAGDVIMCMEYMDCGSLDRISKDFGPVRVDVLGKIAESVLGGLTYLYNVHRIMHRDIKPSNVLVNSKGQIKLCDFGVSGELVNSIADTFVGTSTYMAPERISGAQYSVKSDVWSVGLTLMELAIGRFPFSSSDDDRAAGPMGILDLLQQIVHEPAPRLPKSDAFPSILEDVIDKCLAKDPELRPTPQELFEKDAFLQAAKRTPVDLESWAVSMMERHNRKSHIGLQRPPANKAALREAMSPAPDSASSRTPTYGDIPIAGDIRPSPLSARDINPYGQPTPRPMYPPRISSAAAMAPPQSAGSIATTTLPVRLGSAPNNPLPTPPGTAMRLQSSSRTPGLDPDMRKEARRQAAYGIPYHNGESTPY
ncbi:kinase-like protein [Xylona heveae TC161]|uniref:Kinase-like protein n=1 Tax=Xylona heveae (strain CBS 132557 / TC161) TaxID=1328760 RepID=A0A164ZEI0_XYLHT|nr:kinase-like protein [Xylona heveae TC161]KZF19000.1 kinase-like protein [Xylona heveae TC161]